MQTVRTISSTFEAEKLGVKEPVDFMIRLDQSEWQPERIIKAERGGDFWIWSNEFGRCIGG